MTVQEFILLLYADGLRDDDVLTAVHWDGAQGLHVLHTKRDDTGQVTVTD